MLHREVGACNPGLEDSPGHAPTPPVGEAPCAIGVWAARFAGMLGAASSPVTWPSLRRPMLNDWLSLEVLPGTAPASTAGSGEASGLDTQAAVDAEGAG